MKAAVITANGGLDVLKILDVPKPVAGPGEVVVRVKACALNHLDVFARIGIKGPETKQPDLPHVSGVDVAGIIDEVGPGVKNLKPGDPVVLYPGLFCGECEACQSGEQSMCETYHIFGEHTWGGLAEYCKIKAVNVLKLPEGFPFDQAAALPGAYITAWRMLMTVAKVRAGETVLVMGASGGVGTGCITIARAAGARVIACASGAEKLAKLLAFGADLTIDLRSDDVPAKVKALTAGKGVDIVCDPVGAPTWRLSINSLRKGGRMVICGATGGDNPAISIREIYQRHRQILGAPMGNLKDFRDLLHSVISGQVKPLIHAVLPLERIAEAHALIEDRAVVGKVVIAP